LAEEIELVILARVLMLVACVPLLFPPGFCICKVGGWGAVAPTGQAHVATSQTPKPVLSKSGCCANRDCTGDHTERPASTGDSKSRPGPAPRDDSHMPGCPAAAGADWFKVGEPVQTPVHTLPPVALVPFRLLAVVSVAAPPITTFTNWPSSPPIYLSHCSLVI
jgi:hypothetical protein